jgi:hypothetical protein
VAFALSQIFVIGGAKITDPTGYTDYLQLLENDAFTNYRQIMQDVTLSPAMGDWLDMVNNGKPNTSKDDHANENYAREFMQLFTIGTSQLNPDGSFQLDFGGNQIPTYTQSTVEAFALAYTGWTYPLAPEATPQTYNPPYWTGPMVAVDLITTRLPSNCWFIRECRAAECFPRAVQPHRICRARSPMYSIIRTWGRLFRESSFSTWLPAIRARLIYSGWREYSLTTARACAAI